MGQRLELQTLLETLLGSRNVYFQAPPNTAMQYPCIIYTRAVPDTTFADNDPYNLTKRYDVTVIDRNPEGVIADKVARLRMCTLSRHFVADKLNHDNFTLYF